MRGVQVSLLKLTLFFCWFISFAIVNIEAANWGLQFGWVLAFLFCAAYAPGMVMRPSGYRILSEPGFRHGLHVLLALIGLTFVAWLLRAIGVIQLPDPDLASRSVGHTGYLLYYTFVFICVYHAVRRHGARYWEFFNWFFIYPFVFIAIWGIYQNVATYGIVEYLDIFNNSLSTGFTYDRFRDVHRVSSIFPEPSEYSYYLALLGPVVWAFFRSRLPCRSTAALRWTVLLLWIVQALMVKSLSFFVASPVIAIVCVRHVENKKGLRTAMWVLGIGLMVVGVLALGLSDRISETASGDDGSSLARLAGLLDAVDLFVRSPVIGFGYGIVRGLDALSFTLACFGLIGTLVLWFTIYRFVRSVRQRSTPILSGGVMCLIAGCILSNNVFDHIFIWVLAAMLAAAPRVARVPARLAT